MENIQRKSLLSIRIDCLNGDKFKTGKLMPEGDSDPRAFSTESNREGFQVGTAIALMAKVDAASRRVPAESGEGAASTIRFRHFWEKNAPTRTPL